MKTLVCVLFATLLLNTICSATPSPAAVQASQERAIAKYPDLAKPNSTFNAKFRDLVAFWKRTGPKALENPDWPMWMADQTAQEIASDQKLAAAKSEKPKESSSNDGWKVTKGGFPAALTIEALEKAIRMIEDKDGAALAQMEATGQVVAMKADLEVKIVDQKLFKGLVKIRPKGSTLEAWAPMEILK